MKVLIPHIKGVNPFFDGILKYSKHSFCNATLMTDVEGYSVVLIHWPEILFNGKEPLAEQLLQLESQFAVWKKHTKVVYVVHNLKRHRGMTPNFERLYEIVLKNCDVMVHLGQYSLELYRKKYPAVTHKYIPHPLYDDEFTQYDRNEARTQLGISNKKLVIVAPGRIRGLAERQMVVRGFNALKDKNKILVVPSMFKKTLPLEFRGRHRLKKYIDVKNIVEYIYNKDYFPAYKFSYKFVDFHRLSLCLSCADVVMIPRIDSLNSGNVFLGLTFKKVIVGPEIGNIREFLETFNLPTFNPKDQSSVTAALSKALELAAKNELPYNDKQLHNYKAEIVYLQWDTFLDELVENNI